MLTAEPGAGKSSLVPLLAAEAVDAGPDRRVVVLEPRRLAARATAARLAELLGDRVGGVVGLTMRGVRQRSAATAIEVVTEAVMTNRIQRDPELAGVAAVVFGEFHERNLHSDLGLAMALEARSTIRDDLAVVVMSATIDPGPVAALLGAGDPIAVPGRTFGVRTVHLQRPVPDRWVPAVADAAARAWAETAGDVLVFVPGRWEIDRVRAAVADSRCPGAEVIGLHGGSDGRTQRRVLAGSDRRRVIVATAVAETSVTLPGIEAVVDGGRLRRARFDPLTGLGRLETVQVTRFAADQRRGRAGRLGPGVCYRLWSAEDERLLDESVPPEIVDGDPLPVAFELARWGDPEARHLPLLDRPDPERLAAGRRALDRLGLLDAGGGLSARGRAAPHLGIHPRLAALVLTGAEVGQARRAATVAAALDDDTWPATPDLAAEVERRSADLRRRADQLLDRLRSDGSDRGSDEGRGDSNQRRPVGPGGDSNQRRPVGPGGGADRRLTESGRNEAGGGDASGGAELGELLARAWPDRVALRRPGRPGHYLLASGREAALDADDPLARAELLVVAEADGATHRVRIRRAVALDRAGLHRAVGDAITWVSAVTWNDRTSTIDAEREQRLDAIVLHRQPLDAADPSDVAAAAATGIRRLGVGALGWSGDAVALRARLAWLHAADERWPAVDDETLLARLDEWLDTSGLAPGAGLGQVRVTTQLLGLLDWRQRAELDELAPASLPTPRGRDRRLDYTTGRPVWSVRIQDLFGLDDHPTIGPSASPVTVELLSPAGRPAQVTDDLPGFWRGTYAAVRADLRGRYPKHRWPEEPWRIDPQTG